MTSVLSIYALNPSPFSDVNRWHDFIMFWANNTKNNVMSCIKKQFIFCLLHKKNKYLTKLEWAAFFIISRTHSLHMYMHVLLSMFSFLRFTNGFIDPPLGWDTKIFKPLCNVYAFSLVNWDTTTASACISMQRCSTYSTVVAVFWWLLGQTFKYVIIYEINNQYEIWLFTNQTINPYFIFLYVISI